MKKIEFHCHTKGQSVCADVLDEALINDYVQNGYDGIVITNHLNGTFNKYPGDTYEQKVDYLFSAIDRIKDKAKGLPLEIFCGLEIVALTDDGIHQEFIMIGIDKEFLLKNPLHSRYNQKELFRIAQNNGFFMYQTHPFRNGEKTGDPRYMHGAEAFNAHYHHDNNNEKAQKFCKENGLKMLAGNDYHHQGQPLIACGYIPKKINSDRQLAEYLMSNQPEISYDQKRCLEERQKYLDSIKEK